MKRALLISAITFVAGVLVTLRWTGRSTSPNNADIRSLITATTPTGNLSVFKVISKDVVTKEITKEGSWALNVDGSKKAILVVHSEITVSYCLQDERFQVSRVGDKAIISLPPPTTDINLRDIAFYDKQPGRWLAFEKPWTPKDDTEIIRDAKNDAEERAKQVAVDYRAQYELVARSLLNSIAVGLGCKDAEIQFIDMEVP